MANKLGRVLGGLWLAVCSGNCTSLSRGPGLLSADRQLAQVTEGVIAFAPDCEIKK